MRRVLPPAGKAIVIGVAITGIGAIYSIVLPSATNYLFLPGMMVVYVLTGGVHGDHLPSLPVWYALGGIVNIFLYSLLAFVMVRRFGRRE